HARASIRSVRALGGRWRSRTFGPRPRVAVLQAGGSGAGRVDRRRGSFARRGVLCEASTGVTAASKTGEREMADLAESLGTEIFRSLLDSAPDAMVVADSEGRIVYANAQTERCFGYRREELLGKPIEVLMPERYRQGHIGYRSGFFRAPKARPMGIGLELRGIRRDGTEFPVEISVSVHQAASGPLVSAAIRDVSERAEREQAVRRLAAIVDFSDDAVIG